MSVNQGAYNKRGIARAKQGDLDGAIADFDKAIALNPEFASAYSNRGIARSKQGDLDGATADHDKAIALNPQDAFAYTSRGNARHDQGNLEGAIADYDKAIALNPQDASSNNGICWNGSLLGFAAKVLFVCEKAVKLSDGDPGYRNSRGLARALTGDREGAIEDFQAFLDWGQGHANETRVEWIKALQAGQPIQEIFTPEVIEALKNE